MTQYRKTEMFPHQGLRDAHGPQGEDFQRGGEAESGRPA